VGVLADTQVRSGYFKGAVRAGHDASIDPNPSGLNIIGHHL
jgi:hypothetical protein